ITFRLSSAARFSSQLKLRRSRDSDSCTQAVPDTALKANAITPRYGRSTRPLLKCGGSAGGCRDSQMPTLAGYSAPKAVWYSDQTSRGFLHWMPELARFYGRLKRVGR